MDNQRRRLIGRSLLALGVMIAVAGCASSAPAPAGRWSSRAQSIAEHRLAAAGHLAPDHAAGGAPSRLVAPDVAPAPSYTMTGQADPPSFGQPAKGEAQTRNQAVALTAVRLAADTPVQPTSPAETPAEAPTIERGPLPGFGETVERDLKEMPGLLWEDTKRVYTDPLNVLFLVGAGGASLALRPEADDDIEDYYDRHHTFAEDWRDGFGAAGNPATHFALAGAWYLLGQQTQNVKTYEVGKRMFSALTITGLSTMILKVSANTESPNGENLAWPSGHVSSTMAMATVLNDAYGPLVGVPMFGLTALAAVERLDDREHSFSDVIFGAALGWVVAETVMKEHRPEVFGGEIVPYVDPVNNNAGVAWVKPLGK